MRFAAEQLASIRMGFQGVEEIREIAVSVRVVVPWCDEFTCVSADIDLPRKAKLCCQWRYEFGADPNAPIWQRVRFGEIPPHALKASRNSC